MTNPTKFPTTNSSNNYNGLDTVRKKIDPSKTKIEKYGNTVNTTYFDKNGVAILVFQERQFQSGYQYIGVDTEGKSCIVRLQDHDKDGNIDVMHSWYNKDGSAPQNIYDEGNLNYEYTLSSSEDNGKFDKVVHDNLPWHTKPQVNDKNIFNKFLDWLGK